MPTIYRIPEVAEKFGVAVRTIERWRKKGLLPEPIQMGERYIAFPAEAIDDMLNGRPKN